MEIVHKERSKPQQAWGVEMLKEQVCRNLRPLAADNVVEGSKHKDKEEDHVTLRLPSRVFALLVSWDERPGHRAVPSFLLAPFEH